MEIVFGISELLAVGGVLFWFSSWLKDVEHGLIRAEARLEALESIEQERTSKEQEAESARTPKARARRET